VIIPESNARHLMLNDEVIRIVEKGEFHIWKVANINDAICLLTDMEAGELQSDGSYPQGTFNQAVVDGLVSLAEAGKDHDEKGQREDAEGDESGLTGEMHA
jgi:hypothetical protein